VVLPLFTLWPLPQVATTALVTSPQSEGVAHLWGWWAAVAERSPLAIQTTLLNHPDGLSLPLVDPLHLLPWLLGSQLSVALGFNLVLYLGLLVAGLGGAALARVVGADRSGQVLGACILGSAATIVGVGADGITEGLGIGWVALQFAVLLSLRRDASWSRVGLLAVLVAAAVHSGPYNAIWVAVLDGIVGLWLLQHTWRHLVAGAAAAVVSAPYVLAALGLEGGRPGALDRAGPMPPLPAEVWRGLWREGADLMDLLVPVQFTGAVPTPTTAYLGPVLVVLAIVGCVRFVGGRAQQGGGPEWLVGAVVFAALALGPWICWAGTPLSPGGWELMGPAGVLEQIPGIDRLSRWYRAGAVAVMLLIPPAVAVVSGRRAVLLGLLVVLDARLLGPVPFPLATTAVPTETVLRTLDGPFAELPPIHPLHWAGLQADENLLLQVLHGQPTTGTLDNQPGRATVHPGLAKIRQAALGRAGPDAAEIVRMGAADMVDLGYRRLVVYPDRLGTWSEDILTDALGAPVALDERVVVYDLAKPAE
jgi:hypothetical protein